MIELRVRYLIYIILWTSLASVLLASCSTAEAHTSRLKLSVREQVCHGNYCTYQNIGIYGGAVCVGKDSKGRYIFATVAHAFAKRNPNNRLLRIDVSIGNKWVSAKILNLKLVNESMDNPHQGRDVALLTVEYPGELNTFCLLEGKVKEGEKALVLGTAKGDKIRRIEGKIVLTNAIANPFNFKSDGDPTTQGDSGCPLLVIRNGEYVVAGVMGTYDPHQRTSGFDTVPHLRELTQDQRIFSCLQGIPTLFPRPILTIPIFPRNREPVRSQGIQGPVGPRGPPGLSASIKDSSVVRELRIQDQVLAGEIETLKREIELGKKYVESLNKQLKDLQIANQNQDITIQSNTREIKITNSKLTDLENKFKNFNTTLRLRVQPID